MAERLIIQKGTVVTPAAVLAADVLVDGGRIAGVVEPGAVAWPDARAIDAGGCLVFPGVVDPHTHIVLDTGIYKSPDDWEVGTRTAACGGVTTVIDFATQFPGQDMHQALAGREAEIGGLAQIDYGLHMMLTQLPEDDVTLHRWMADLLGLGISAVKVYTTYRPNYYQTDAELLRVLAAAAAQDMVVMVHCENDDMVTAAREALERAGTTSLAYHGKARPALAETEAANRVLFMADGQIVEENTPEEFFTNPQTDRCKDFLSKILTH